MEEGRTMDEKVHENTLIVIDRFIILMMAVSFTGVNICQSISNYTLKHMQFNIYQ